MRPPRLHPSVSVRPTRRASPRPAPRIYGYVGSCEQRPRSPKDLIEPQQEALDAWASGASVAFAHVFVERGFDKGCALFEREQGKAALRRMRPGDRLIAARFERLFASPEHAHASLALARERKFAVCALDVDAGRLRLEGSRSLDAILLALAADTTYARSLQGKAVKGEAVKLGRYRGGQPPFGYSIGANRELVPVPEELAFIAQLHRMKADKFTLEQMRQAGLELSHDLTRAGIGKILKRGV